jgi:hypothetical protein
MSRRPIARSPDLKKLRDEGYDIEIVSGYLVVHDVPYLNAKKEIKRGVLAAALQHSNNIAQPPENHVALFAGDCPCHLDGTEMARIGCSATQVKIGNITANYSFSAKPKPKDNYDDFHHKMSHYVNILSGPAQAIDPAVTAKVFKPHRPDKDDSPFLYEDTASSRADILAATEKMALSRIDIVGAGGTGSYVLDLVTKTHVVEIHIWDSDIFYDHNAFRAPSAASGEELEEKLHKVEYLARIYSKMRMGVVPHPVKMTAEHLGELAKSKFVFLCMEGPGKKPIVEKLEELGIPFIDVGMGVYMKNDSLGGLLRVTTSTPTMRDHVHTKGRIAFTKAEDVNEYDKNIQIAELNALNAALAVIKWKKLFGFYLDQENEHYSLYAIGGNDIDNEDTE